MLWLALQFTRLALDTRPGAERAPEPLAVIEAQGPRRIVVAANAAARAQGVRCDQVLGAAQALCAGLQTELRNPADEEATMRSLALWALGYSSLVARHGVNTLLVEVGASRRLFGNERKLLQAIARDLEAEGHTCVAGLAATATAARLFAQAGVSRIVRDSEALRETVAPLALIHGDLSAAACDALAGVGVRHYGALLKLPRNELARRFGQAVPDHLDALLGRRAEVIVPLRVDARFRQKLEWSYAMSDTQALLFPSRRLIVAAAHWLVACQKSVLRLRLAFAHEDHPDTLIEIGLGRASADREHLLAVVRARLDQLTLPQGACALTLELVETETLSAPTRDLFVRQGEAAEDAQQLLERLQGRLGDTAVERFVLREDHRPERGATTTATASSGSFVGAGHARDPAATSPSQRADHARDPAATSPSQRADHARDKNAASTRHRSRAWPAPTKPGEPAQSPRPLFLLEHPQPLAQWPSFDWRRARLSLPERIESGWWDDADATRDYYRIDQQDGPRLWVFRDRQSPQDWFVQGVYA
jgi:protein ImuB